MPCDHVMVDLETLGTHADSVIMSIGAVKFDLNSDKLDDNGFYASISIDSNIIAGRKFSESTLLFWLKQEPAAQAVFHEPKQSLEAALEALSDWWEAPGTVKGKHIWSNGADFDIPMLAHAYRGFDWLVPWEFYNARCVRTYKTMPGAPTVPRTGVKHNALDDAIYQVRLVQAIQKSLAVKHPMVKA